MIKARPFPREKIRSERDGLLSVVPPFFNSLVRVYLVWPMTEPPAFDWNEPGAKWRKHIRAAEAVFK